MDLLGDYGDGEDEDLVVVGGDDAEIAGSTEVVLTTDVSEDDHSSHRSVDHSPAGSREETTGKEVSWLNR